MQSWLYQLIRYNIPFIKKDIWIIQSKGISRCLEKKKRKHIIYIVTTAEKHMARSRQQTYFSNESADQNRAQGSGDTCKQASSLQRSRGRVTCTSVSLPSPSTSSLAVKGSNAIVRHDVTEMISVSSLVPPSPSLPPSPLPSPRLVPCVASPVASPGN